ncbi:MAG TPA: NAD-dependent epimerase/dehydratase family protein [Burkholderiaceae bacterium]|jgi:nucleoside-diphosphate-sugar epimerase|nr:NAD-dependent epimerase/dehydratase family protein [Burkholderiaceae bacterium]
MKRIVVFGYGAVGREVAALLVARGDDVVVAQRAAPKTLRAGVAFKPCDLTQPALVAAACAGREIAICAAGFAYDSRVWEHAWPMAMQALLDACEAAKARFVFADNLYMAGPQTKPLTEDMPLTNYGRKPRVRSQITRMWQQAHQAGRVRSVAVRASDFYGPDVPTSMLSAFGVAPLVAGKPAFVPYSPDFPHDFTYVPDFARALVTLADAPDDAYGQAWNVPNAPTRSLRELLALAARIAGVPLRLFVLPAWLQPVLGLFVPEVRELIEMRFQTDRPYRVDATKFSARFGPRFTSFEEGLAATVEFYRRMVAEKAA